MRQLPILFLLFWLTSCEQKTLPSDIIIEGYVKNIPNGKVYLTEAHQWNVFLDSTVSTDGHFKFIIKPDSSFYPYLASICFRDTSSPGKIEQLVYANELYQPKDLAKGIYHYNSGFYLEEGVTQIYGENKQGKAGQFYTKIKAGRENELFYKDEIHGFGWPGQPTIARRTARIDLFKQYIEDHPYSYFLLQSLFDAKVSYSEQEMRELLSLFDQEIQNSGLGNKVRTYLALRNDPGTPVANLLLLNSDWKRQHIINKEAELNMLIFWASWCKGCREEIPLLKEIHAKYAGKPLNMVSISMDKHPERWHQAMGQEQMTCPQYIADSNQIETIRQQYNFDAIPLIVFTDGNGREIKRFTGNKSNSSAPYVRVIETALLKNSVPQ